MPPTDRTIRTKHALELSGPSLLTGATRKTVYLDFGPVFDAFHRFWSVDGDLGAAILLPAEDGIIGCDGRTVHLFPMP